MMLLTVTCTAIKGFSIFEQTARPLPVWFMSYEHGFAIPFGQSSPLIQCLADCQRSSTWLDFEF